MLSNHGACRDLTPDRRSRLILWLIAPLVVFSLLALPGACSADTPVGYDDHDYQKLRAFLELPNGAEKNGDRIGTSTGYDPDDPSTWGGVTWSEAAQKRVTRITWPGHGLIGNLDVSGCTELEYLDCFVNQLAGLDVSDCTKLLWLHCHSNRLTTLDVSGCAVLWYLDCKQNLLSSLDVSDCAMLGYLWCHDNQLTFPDLPPSLPVSGGTYQYAPQTYTQIGSGGVVIAGQEIDLSDQANIGGTATVYTWYDGDETVITPTTAGGGKFTFDETFDGETIYCVMTNGAFPALTLETIRVVNRCGYDDHDYQRLRAFLELPNGSGKNGDKTFIGTGYDPDDPSTWGGVIWSKAIQKRLVEVAWPGLDLVGDLDVSGCTALSRLDCSRNQLTSLDPSGCTALSLLDCSRNQLTSLDVSGLAALVNLYCYGNELISLDVSGCAALVNLHCDGNKLISLDLSGLAALAYSGCRENRLTSLNVSGCTALSRLDCDYNKLADLDLRDCAAMTRLNCSNNELTSLDLSHCPSMRFLSCGENRLTSLNLSGAVMISDLQCQNNQLTSLDVSGRASLSYLDCSNNELTSLDVAGCRMLWYLRCHDNRLTFADLPPSLTYPGAKYLYTPQACISIGIDDVVIAGQEIDLSDQADIEGIATVFTWYDGEDTVITPTTADGGKFTFDTTLEGQTVYCAMTNATFPALTLETTRITLRLLNTGSYGHSDYEKLRAFLELPNGSEKNGDKIGPSYDPNDPETWGGVTWSESTPKRVTEIAWPNKDLVGNLDLGGCTKLVSLYCDHNQLTDLDVNGCTTLEELWCHDNQLTFADLPLGLPVSGGTYLYAPQAHVPIGSNSVVTVGQEIDLSAEASIEGVDTVFTWYEGEDNEITPTTADGGKFTFDETFEGQTFYCEMNNASFPVLVLRTVSVLVDTHQITFIKPTDANDESNPVNINSGSLVIAQIDGDMNAVSGVTVSVDGGENQDVIPSGSTVYYLLPAGLESGEHTITVELTTTAEQRISEEITFHWDSYRRGFGFGRFDFGDADTR